MQIHTSIPDSYTAGTTLTIRRTLPAYPVADGWQYSFNLRGSSVPPTAFVSTADGDAHVTTVPAGMSQMWQGGTYQYAELVTRGDEVVEIGRGRIEVRASVAGFADVRSHAERTLEIITNALEGRLVDGIQNYSIAGRAVSKIPITELVKLRGVYAAIVWRERNPGQLGQSLKVTFGGN